MRNKKRTSKDIISDLIDIDIELEYTEESSKEWHMLHTERENIIQQLENKVDGIDWYIRSVDQRLGAIEGEKKAVHAEKQRILRRQRAVERTKDYLSNTLLPMIIKTVGTDGTFETATAKYTLYESYGSVNVEDTSKLPAEYFRTKRSVNTNELRKALMDGQTIKGATIEKVERVRRT